MRLGFNLTTVPDGHLCCGSAGTYSLTQPELARQLRDNKMNALESGYPEVIVTANIGCQSHLDGAGRTPSGTGSNWSKPPCPNSAQWRMPMNSKAVLSQAEVSRILAAARTEAQANQMASDHCGGR